MIVTFTANPSVDRTVALGGPLHRGEVHRACSVTEHPGGKGVNVARVVAAAGIDVVAVLPGTEGDPVLGALAAAGIRCRAVSTGAAPRVNLTLTEPDGTTTKINEPGHPIDPGQRTELVAVLAGLAADARWVALSGSLPPGVPTGWYAELVAALRPARVAVDTSDQPLLELVAALDTTAPDLLKPNAEELAQITGAEAIEDPAAAACAAATLVERGVGAVLATLGAAGAVLVTREGAWSATAPRIVPRSTVGAGDSALAGYLLADVAGAAPADRLRAAVAYGSAATALPGTELPGPAHPDLAAVTVTALSPLPHL